MITQEPFGETARNTALLSSNVMIAVIFAGLYRSSAPGARPKGQNGFSLMEKGVSIHISFSTLHFIQI